MLVQWEDNWSSNPYKGVNWGRAGGAAAPPPSLKKLFDPYQRNGQIKKNSDIEKINWKYMLNSKVYLFFIIFFKIYLKKTLLFCKKKIQRNIYEMGGKNWDITLLIEAAAVLALTGAPAFPTANKAFRK